ncbi:hypothetical protein GDO86_017865 [Hymenochirus boettgeri]|uniref:FHA domain-containing protein n=1 Tax=Hymenochirus boettgeri TaxID=247094 RepID=A0A8T2IIM1_9PIPI|nr:hypothetical protein GDO86_017865 [Hymenochirus boettgeri]
MRYWQHRYHKERRYVNEDTGLHSTGHAPDKMEAKDISAIMVSRSHCNGHFSINRQTYKNLLSTNGEKLNRKKDDTVGGL